VEPAIVGSTYPVTHSLCAVVVECRIDFCELEVFAVTYSRLKTLVVLKISVLGFYNEKHITVHDVLLLELRGGPTYDDY